MPLPEAFQEVLRCCGTQFDEKITTTFFNVLRKELSGEIHEPQILPHLQRKDVSGLRAVSSMVPM
jgi:HD-GYP domain-containing protein (c-di-GMP phosphodiesterase class II)